MKIAYADNVLSMIPETVKEALLVSKIQRAMYEDGLDAKEEELEGANTSFLFGILRRPGPRKRQPQEQPDGEPSELPPRRKGAEMVPEPLPPEA